MKVSKAQAAENRRRIVDAAARLYREQGFEGVGVTEIAQAAGLTHGGLYRHFNSKESLTAEACSRAFDWRVETLDSPGKPTRASVSRLASIYLSPSHRDNPGDGCPVAALATDCARAGGQAAQAFAQGFTRYLEAFTANACERRSGGRPDSRDRQEALSEVIHLVGALVLARAVAPADRKLSDEIMSVARKSLSHPAQGDRHGE